jgi:uncharacterized membrane protein
LYLIILSSASALLPVSVGSIKYSRLKESLKPLFLLAVISLIFDLSGIILSLNNINNVPLFHLFSYISYILFGRFYFLIFNGTKTKEKLKYLIIILIVLALYNSFFVQGLDKFDTYTTALQSIFFISLAISFFIQTFREAKITNLESHPYFWINTSIILYFSWNFWLFLFLNENLVDLRKFIGDYYFIHGVLYIFFNILITIGFWKGSKN